MDETKDLVQDRLRALINIENNKARVTRHYNKKMVSKRFKEGDLVWKTIFLIRSNDNRFGKWSPNWEGPFKNGQCAPGNAYMLHSLDGEEFGHAVNGKYLKRYYPSVWIDGYRMYQLMQKHRLHMANIKLYCP